MILKKLINYFNVNVNKVIYKMIFIVNNVYCHVKHVKIILINVYLVLILIK